MSLEIHRDLGKHEAQIESLNEQVKRMHEDQQLMMAQLADIKQTLSEAKGGWKTLMWVGGFSAALGGIIVKVMTWMQILPK
jgi:hypothetical protein